MLVLLQVLELEGKDKGEWGFKALKQMIKINFKLVSIQKEVEPLENSPCQRSVVIFCQAFTNVRPQAFFCGFTILSALELFFSHYGLSIL